MQKIFLYSQSFFVKSQLTDWVNKDLRPSPASRPSIRSEGKLFSSDNLM